MTADENTLPGLPSKVSSAAAESPTWNTAAFLNAAPEAPRPAAAKPSPYAANNEHKPALNLLFRHSSWQHFRSRVEAALASIDCVSERRHAAFCACGSDAYVESCQPKGPSGPTKYRVRSTKCHDRFCVPCSNERSMRVRTAILEHTKTRKQMSLFGLTLMHSDRPLGEQLDRIQDAFKKLRNTSLWKKSVTGGAAIIEIKISENTKRWHVHYHILAEAKYLPQDKLSAAWLKITGDSNITDVRRVGSMNGAVQYITKYITKAADSSIVRDPVRLKEAIQSYIGRRLVSTFGTWRGLALMEKREYCDEDEDPNAPWTSLGPLYAIISAAARRDPEALNILRAVSPRRIFSSA